MVATPEPDYYEILGIAAGADNDEIKRAYRRQSAASHPDRGGSPWAFRMVQIAHDTLSDPYRRKVYDRRNTTAAEPAAPDHRTAEPSPAEPHFHANTSNSSPSSPTLPPPFTDSPDGASIKKADRSPSPKVFPGYFRGLPVMIMVAVADAAVLAEVWLHWPVGVVPKLFFFVSMLAAPLCPWVAVRPDLVALRWPPVAAAGALLGGIGFTAWRVRHLPVAPTLIGLAAAHALLGLLLIPAWRTYRRTRVLNRVVPRSVMTGSRVFGTPGTTLPADAAVAVRRSADRLFTFAETFPGVSVIHLAGLPVEHRATTADHAVLAGTRAALVAVYPLPGGIRYTFDGYGNLLADGQHFPNDAAAFRQAISILQKALPRRFEVRGFIATEGAAEPATVDGAVTVVGKDALCASLSTWLTAKPAVVRRDALAVLARYSG